MEKIKLAIIDDDYLIVTLLKQFFNDNADTTVVFDATDGCLLLGYLEEQGAKDIDVLLLDLKMKTINGLELLQHIKEKYPDLKTIIISSHYEDQSIGFMTRQGATGFLPKGISPFELLDIIRQVYQNGFYLSAEQMEVLREQISEKAPKPILKKEEELLSEREIEILKLLCHQKTAKEIGEALFISHRTIEGHKNRLFAKIGVRNAAGLVVYALQSHLITLDELVLNEGIRQLDNQR